MSDVQPDLLDPDPNSITIPVPPTATPPGGPPADPPRGRAPRQPRTFTEEEVERIRQEEKDKLYSRLGKVEDLEKTVSELQAEREARLKEQAKLEREAAAAAKKKADEETELRELITRKDQEWEARLNEEKAARERMEAVLQKEREYADLMNYRAQLMASEAGEQIMPEFRDLVQGSTKEAIDASFQDLIRRSEAAGQKFQGIVDGRRAALPGSTITAPPVGPLEGVSQTRTFSPEDIRNIPNEEWPQYREALKAAASQQRRGQ